MASKKRNPLEKQVLLQDLNEETTRRIIAKQARIVSQKVIRNPAMDELETGGFGGGFSRRDKGWLLLGFAFFYIVCLLFGYTPSIRMVIGGGILSAFFLFLVVFFIEEFTRFKFPRIRIPLVDDLIYYAFNIVWEHRIISGGIIFGLVAMSSFFVGTEDWGDLAFDAGRGVLEEQCADEQWKSCVRLGDYWYHGITEVKKGQPVMGNDRDTTKAFTFYKKGCDGGVGEGCLLLWLMWGRKDTYALEREEALAYLKKSCDLDGRYACEILDLYDKGVDLSRDTGALNALADDLATEAGIFLPSAANDDSAEEE